jgi:seryl-tRNA synthetase
VVAFTKDGEATISKYVQDGRLAEIIEVRTAQATLQDLQKAQKDASKLVQRLGFNIASSINVFENRVEVYATDRTELEEALRESGKKLPDHVVIIGP